MARSRSCLRGHGRAEEAHEVVEQDGDRGRLCTATDTHHERTRGVVRSAGTPRAQRVALERPDGLLVERLPDAGLTVIAMDLSPLAARATGSYRRAASLSASIRRERSA